MNFDTLARQISTIDQHARRDTVRAVNVGLILCNWAIGFYIDHYKLNREGRAQYGDQLFDNLASRLHKLQKRSCDRRQLYRYREFFTCYPQIVELLSPQLATTGNYRNGKNSIGSNDFTVILPDTSHDGRAAYPFKKPSVR